MAKNSAKNRMQIHNLAIVFGPSLFSSNPSAKSGTDTSKKPSKKKVESKSSTPKDASNANEFKNAHSSSTQADVTHSNSQLAFTMILQGQIVEYLLKEHAKFFETNSSVE